MSEPHTVLNELSADEARAALTRCCGSARWVAGMLALRPWPSTVALLADAALVWGGLARNDYLEAFQHHPRIGVRGNDVWARQEQARTDEAKADTMRMLQDANDRYFEQYGYIFIVCATGKTADEMLGLLQGRLGNDPLRELATAAGEQAKITELRLRKLAS